MENVKKTSRKSTVKEMAVLDLISKAVEVTKGAKEIAPKRGMAVLKELQARLSLETPTAASLFSVCVDQSDDYNMGIKELAAHYDVRPLAVWKNYDDIESLIKRQMIKTQKGDNKKIVYRVTMNVMNQLRENVPCTPKNLKGLNIYDFIYEIEEIIDLVEDDHNYTDKAFEDLEYLVENNMHLYFAQKLKNYFTHSCDFLLYLKMVILYVNNNDDYIRTYDFEGVFVRRDVRYLRRSLENGSNPLFRDNLIDNSCVDGIVDPTAWRLSDYSKDDLLRELKFERKIKIADVTRNEDIKEKRLYYNERVGKEVRRLEELLDEERMKRVLKKMAEKGMRSGFTCIFYGSPGTGKTETAMQLAKASGRDLMVVNIPQIRSKWVGETEKNIKRVFDQYKSLAKDNARAPILLFNEADAILTSRLEGGRNAVDKMENTMQNIILQEMETLEGVMIATTNLTGNLDSAFERRFLYKIEFDKPSAEERSHIWKEMIADLSDEQAYQLAERYDFTGGQIENIARKRLVNDILNETEELNIDEVIESCEVERLEGKRSGKVGFCLNQKESI